MTTTLDLTAQVEELREIAGRMTPGEWRHERRRHESHVLQTNSKLDSYASRVACCPQWSTPALQGRPDADQAEANATGIVALRNTALPIIDAQAAEIARLREVLRVIADWETPRLPDRLNMGQTVHMSIAIGSNGERDYMRQIARAALAQVQPFEQGRFARIDGMREEEP